MNWDFSYEYKLGKTIAIDEVGRGPLAGPVVSCAIIFPSNTIIQGIRDSKKLSSKKREKLAEIIKLMAIDYDFGEASSKEIDDLGIVQATHLSMIRAVKNLHYKGYYYPLLIDYERLDFAIEQYSITKGDEKIIGIAAASILAKVYRDQMAIKWNEKYPGYFFNTNKGYGTKAHRNALEKLGLTPIHRKSFCKRYIK